MNRAWTWALAALACGPASVQVGDDDPFGDDPFADTDDATPTEDDPEPTESPTDEEAPVDTELPDVDEDDWIQPRIPCQPGKVIVADDAYDTIEDAIEAADGRAVVYVCRGKYTENLEINGDVFLRGDDDADTQIDGGGRGPILRVRSGNVVVEWLTLQNGAGIRGGAIAQEGPGTVSIRNAIVKNNRAEHGGGIYGGAGAIEVASVTFQSNRSTVTDGLGGAIVTRGLLAVTDGTFVANQGDKGAAIATSGVLEMTDSEIRENDAGQSTIFLDSGAIARLSDSTLDGNQGGLHGAIIAVEADLTLENVTFVHNTARGSADCLTIEDGTLNITDVRFLDNVSVRTDADSSNSGCLQIIGGDSTIRDVTFERNGAGEGYAAPISAFEGAEIEIERAVFSGNSSTAGGALAASNSTIRCEDCDFQDNGAFWGGAVFAESGAEIEVDGGTFTGQMATYGVNVYAAADSVVTLTDAEMVATTIGAQGPVGWLLDDATLVLQRLDLTLPTSSGAILKEVEFGDSPGAGANISEGLVTLTCSERTRSCVAP